MLCRASELAVCVCVCVCASMTVVLEDSSGTDSAEESPGAAKPSVKRVVKKRDRKPSATVHNKVLVNCWSPNS